MGSGAEGGRRVGVEVRAGGKHLGWGGLVEWGGVKVRVGLGWAVGGKYVRRRVSPGNTSSGQRYQTDRSTKT